VTVAAEGLPAGVTASSVVMLADPSSARTSSSFSIAVAATAVPGTYPVTLRATGIGVSASTVALTLTVEQNPASITSVTIAGTVSFSFSPSSPIKQTGQLAATANRFDGGGQIVTTQSTWQSSNASVVTVASSGLLTAVGVGQAEIRATYQGVTGTIQSTVSSTPLNLTGTFSGRATASNGISGPMSLILTQTGSSISGNGTTFYEYQWPATAVLATGTVSGSTVTLTLAYNGGSCPITFTHAVTAATNSSIAGTYAKAGGCNNTTITGTFAVIR
jgi:hypothetical protein